MPRCRLLAIDVDGTLLRDDGTIAPVDREAVLEARRAGITVTLATGRLGPSAMTIARKLDLRAPLVCADGGATFCPRTEALLAIAPLASAKVDWLLAGAAKSGLCPFVLTPERVLAPPEAERLSDLIGWSPHIVSWAELVERPNVAPRSATLTAFAMGDESRVQALAKSCPEPIRNGTAISAFGMGESGLWALRESPEGASKATGLEGVAERLGLRRSEVATIGDWYNDIAMLSWAGESFAMGQAPAPVARAARYVLQATARTGGGVAEAVEQLLSPRREPLN